MYLIVIAASTVSVLAILKLPSWTNARVKMLVESVEDNHAGVTKGYMVHISEKTSFMKWRYKIPLLFFVVIGSLIMLACLLVIQELQGYGQMNEPQTIAFTLIITAFALFFVSGFPLGVCLLAFIRSNQVVVVSEQGLEVWKNRGRETLITKKVLWLDIKKVLYCRYNFASSRMDYNLRMYTTKERLMVMGDYTNMPRFVADILHRANNANYGFFNDRWILEELVMN
jgi:hypothetical protein